MVITKLVLEKYKRLMLSNIQRFEYTPTKEMQLIIGSNGSGKSSLLEELTPLPAHHSGFLKGGRKEFCCEHRGSQYHLHSNYNGGSGEHSFQRNGEELNKGGTFAIQKELVLHEFGVDREIHELLIGQTPFSAMSTAKRREWLTRMSPSNLTYAFDSYNRMKTLHRDQQGVIKHLTKRMVIENQDLPDENERALHYQAIKRLTEKLNRLFEERSNEVQPAFQNATDPQRLLQQALNRARALLTQTPKFPVGLSITSADELTALLQERQTQQQVQRSLLDRLVDEHHQLLQNNPARDEALSDEQIQTLRTQLTQLQTERASLVVPVSEIPVVSLPMDRNPRELLDQTFQEWVSLIHSFPDNADGRFTQERGRQGQETLQQLKSERQQKENRQTQIVQRLARLKGCEAVECPACTHTFTPGVNPQEVVLLESELTTCFERLQELDSAILTAQEYNEAFNDYLGFVRAFKRLVEHSDGVFRPVWDFCLENQVMYRQPRRYLPSVTQWHQAMTIQLQIHTTEQHVSVLEHKLRYVEAIDRTALTQLDQRRQTLETEIDTQTQALRQTDQEIQELVQIQTELVRYAGELAHVVQQIEGLRSKVHQQVVHEYQTAVREETQHTQITLAQHQEVLSRIDLRDGVLADIQKQHEQAQLCYQEYGICSKALAPTDGLIGRYLMGFMQNIVKLINAVIEEIWTYPMEVLPSQVESDELDYRFPLNVNDGALIAPDISRGSSSQVDVVDFAFKLLVMKFLRLDEFPLYLDEFGSTFDEQHRENLIPFINRMVELGQIRQIFLISHFSTTHGAFNQAEVCVLDPTNITVPQVYNKHVVIA